MSFHFYYESSSPEPTLTPPTVPIDSRTFLFGDHAYEVLRTYNHIPFCVEEHFDRMLDTLDYLKYSVYPSIDTYCQDMSVITKYAYQTLKLKDELYIRTHFGRSPDQNVKLAPDPTLIPVWVYICSPLQTYVDTHIETHGMRLSVSPYFRHLNTSFSPNAKTGNYLNNMLGSMDAKERGFDDAVFLNPTDGTLCEGSNFNLAFIDDHGEMVFMDPGTLPCYLLGITQRVFTDKTDNDRPPWRYEKVTLQEAKRFPFALALSTTKELQWISTIEDVPFEQPTDTVLKPYRDYFCNIVKQNTAHYQKNHSNLQI